MSMDQKNIQEKIRRILKGILDQFDKYKKESNYKVIDLKKKYKKDLTDEHKKEKSEKALKKDMYKIMDWDNAKYYRLKDDVNKALRRAMSESKVKYTDGHELVLYWMNKVANRKPPKSIDVYLSSNSQEIDRRQTLASKHPNKRIHHSSSDVNKSVSSRADEVPAKRDKVSYEEAASRNDSQSNQEESAGQKHQQTLQLYMQDQLSRQQKQRIQSSAHQNQGQSSALRMQQEDPSRHAGHKDALNAAEEIVVNPDHPLLAVLATAQQPEPPQFVMQANLSVRENLNKCNICPTELILQNLQKHGADIWHLRNSHKNSRSRVNAKGMRYIMLDLECIGIQNNSPDYKKVNASLQRFSQTDIFLLHSRKHGGIPDYNGLMDLKSEAQAVWQEGKTDKEPCPTGEGLRHRCNGTCNNCSMFCRQ